MPKIAFTADKVVAFITALLFFLIPIGFGLGAVVFAAYFVFFVLWKHKHIPFIASPILYGLGLTFLGFLLSSFFSFSPEDAFLNWQSPLFFVLPFVLIVFCADQEAGDYLKYALYSGIPYSIYLGVTPFFIDQAFDFPTYLGELFLLLFALNLPLSLVYREDQKIPLLHLTFGLSSSLFLLLTQPAFIKVLAIYAFFLFWLTRRSKKIFLIGFTISFLLMLGLAHREYKSPITGALTAVIYQQKTEKIPFPLESYFNDLSKSPLLGFGANQHKLAEERKITYIPEDQFPNLYLSFWYQYGLAGLIGLLFWWGILLVKSIELLYTKGLTIKEHSLAAGLLLSLTISILAEYSYSNFSTSSVQVLILVIQGMTLSLLWNKKGRPDQL